MTVVVYDGTSLAVDRGVTDGFTMWEQDKAWRFGNYVITGTGHMATVLALKEWFIQGGSEERFPLVHAMGDTFSELIVASDHGLIRFERSPRPIDHGHNKCAFGTGKDFAYGALAMGATAEQAVHIANRFSIHCGMGVDVFNFKGESDD